MPCHRKTPRLTFGIRTRITVCALMIAAPLTAILILVLLDARELARERAFDRVEASLRAVRAEALDWLRSTSRKLEIISGRLERRGSLPDCSSELQQLMGPLDAIEVFSVINVDGTIVCSSLATAPRSNVADRQYFRTALANPGAQPAAPIQSRNTGRMMLPVVMAARRDGRPFAIVLIGLDLQLLLERESAVHGHPNANLTMWTPNGDILARIPASDRLVGQRLPDNPVVRELAALSEPLGSFEAVGLDNKQRRFVAGRIDLPGFPTWLVAGIPSAELVSAGQNITHVGIALCLVMFLGGVLMAVAWSEVSLSKPLLTLAAAARGTGSAEAARRACDASGILELVELSNLLPPHDGSVEIVALDRDPALAEGSRA